MTDLLNTQEAAKILRLAPQTLAEWRTRKSMFGPSYIKVGRKVFYHQADIDQWLESRKLDHKATVIPHPKPKREKQAERLRETLNLPRVPRGRTRRHDNATEHISQH